LVAKFSNGKNGLWDLATDKLAWVFPEGVLLHRADFSLDGRRLVTLEPSQDGIAQVWDTQSGQRLAILRHPVNITATAFSPDGQSLATVTHDGLIRLWDVASQRELEIVGRHADATAVAFSRDGRRLASAGFDLRLWPLMPRSQELIDLGCARVRWPLSAAERERSGVSEEWCSEAVSQNLRAHFDHSSTSAAGR
jgi:WD40 repeat protein